MKIEINTYGFSLLFALLPMLTMVFVIGFDVLLSLSLDIEKGFVVALMWTIITLPTGIYLLGKS